jgi:hypothetical protein
VAVVPTGDPVRDARQQATRQRVLRRHGREQAALAQLAAHHGQPAPTTPRGLLGLLAAAGILEVDERRGHRRSRVAAPLPLVEEFLQLPTERAAWLRRIRASDRSSRFSGDVVALALWGANHTVVAGLRDLADRLLAAPQQVGQTLGHARDTGLLLVTGDLTDLAAPVTLTALPRQSP